MTNSQQETLAAVLARSSTDWKFRQRLKSDPKRTLELTYGLQIPEEFRIRFIERGEDLDALVVLPDFSVDNDGEVSDDELEQVNGGTGVMPW